MSSSIDARFSNRRLVAYVAAVAFAATAWIGWPHAGQAQQNWFPISVEVWDPPFGAASPRKDATYEALPKAAKPWRLCVSIPHLKDSYWLGVNFGIAAEAKRLGVTMETFEAGGYDNLPLQIEQIRRCVSKGSDGLIVGAISAAGLNDVIAEARDKNIPVIDLVNGIESDRISARSAVSFRDMGFMAGRYVAEYAGKAGRDVRVAWFPGPRGAGWVAAGDDGFRAALKGSRAVIVATGFGDTGLQRQESLVTAALVQNQQIDFIVGTAVTAEAAVEILRRQKLSDKIKVMAYYYSPGVHRHIRRGAVVAAPTDMQVIQGRIAVDQVTRILENKPYLRHVGPKIKVIDRAGLRDFDVNTTLAPVGFHPVMNVN